MTNKVGVIICKCTHFRENVVLKDEGLRTDLVLLETDKILQEMEARKHLQELKMDVRIFFVSEWPKQILIHLNLYVCGCDNIKRKIHE